MQPVRRALLSVSDKRGLVELARSLGLGFDAINSNTFQDQPGQRHSYHCRCRALHMCLIPSSSQLAEMDCRQDRR